jgi:hypothetical protein
MGSGGWYIGAGNAIVFTSTGLVGNNEQLVIKKNELSRTKWKGLFI